MPIDPNSRPRKRLMCGEYDLTAGAVRTYGAAMLPKRLAALPALTWPVIAFGGEASGQFTAGKRPPIRPKYAAAYETRDQRDARKTAIEVVLSEEPIDVAAAAAELDPHSNVINQKALRD